MRTPVCRVAPLHRPRTVDWGEFFDGSERWKADPGLLEELAALLPDTTDDIPVR